MLKVLFLSLLLSACTFQAGISYHTEGADSPEIYMPNPLGIVRLVRGTKYGENFCEHISSGFRIEDGYGFNHCGFLYEF